MNKISTKHFTTNFTPESSYILGLLWADGYLPGIYDIRIEALKDDLLELYPTFQTTGQWKFSERIQRNKNWQPQAMIRISNRDIVAFLKDHFYGPKTYKDASSILNKIPKNLQPFWFRGLIDGDGCWHLNKKHYLRHFVLAGHYTQEWNFFTDLLKSLQVNPYSLKRQVNKKGKNSVIKVTNKNGIEKLGNFIYKTYTTDQIGLKRKYNKWKEITESYIR